MNVLILTTIFGEVHPYFGNSLLNLQAFKIRLKTEISIILKDRKDKGRK
jgi:hypothetical protein